MSTGYFVDEAPYRPDGRDETIRQQAERIEVLETALRAFTVAIAGKEFSDALESARAALTGTV